MHSITAELHLAASVSGSWRCACVRAWWLTATLGHLNRTGPLFMLSLKIYKWKMLFIKNRPKTLRSFNWIWLRAVLGLFDKIINIISGYENLIRVMSSFFWGGGAINSLTDIESNKGNIGCVQSDYGWGFIRLNRSNLYFVFQQKLNTWCDLMSRAECWRVFSLA